MKENLYDPLIKYLRDNNIPGDVALRIIKNANNSNSVNKRAQWKMVRFQMYLWERLDEDKKGKLKKKIDTVATLVKTPEYKRAYKLYNSGPMDEHMEIKRLKQLISEPRQELVWQSKNFSFYGKPTKKIPQKIIDKIR